jgi:hypothetical protein
MRRASSGKPLALTPRDLLIFQALRRYRYLRSTYLHAFAGGLSEKRFKERLGDLFHEGYLDRPAAQWRFADSRNAPAVYELAKAGLCVLAERDTIRDEARIVLSAKASKQFLHTLMICEVLASIELAISQRTGLRFIPWLEILAKAPGVTRSNPTPQRFPAGPCGHIVPDAVFGIGYKGATRDTYRFFALEADRGTMPIERMTTDQSSYEKKILAYRVAASQQNLRAHLGVPNLLVLTVTTSAERGARILSTVKSVGGSDGAIFLVKSIGEDGKKPMFELATMPWSRAGYDAITIAEG